MEFLLETPSVGYTPAELADQTEIPRGSVGPTLKRLEEAGLVRHKNRIGLQQRMTDSGLRLLRLLVLKLPHHPLAMIGTPKTKGGKKICLI